MRAENLAVFRVKIDQHRNIHARVNHFLLQRIYMIDTLHVLLPEV